MEKVSLELTIDDANNILAALGQQPYLKVVDLIQKIQGQGAAQMKGNPQAEVAVLENGEASTITNGQNGK